MTSSKNIICEAELKGHEARVWGLSWHPKLPMFASCSEDTTARIWYFNEKNGEWKQIAVIGDNHRRTIRSCAFSSDGMSLALASFDGTTSIWSCKADLDKEDNREYVSSLEGHESEVKDVAWSSDGGLVATCGRDKSIWVWEVFEDYEFECLAILQDHTQDVKRVIWNPNKEYLASTSYDNTIRLWEEGQSDWYCKDTLRGHLSTVWSADFDPEGQSIISSGQDGTLRLWNIDNIGSNHSRYRNVQEIHSNYNDDCLYSVSWGKVNNLIATGSAEGSLKVFKLEDKSIKEVGFVPNSHGYFDVNCVKWCDQKGGNFEYSLLSAGDDCIIRVWKLDFEVL